MTNQGKISPVRNSSVGLMLKVAGLFAVSFVLFFMVFLAYDLLSAFNRDNTPAVQVTEEIKPDVDIPKIADDLAKVLASNAEPYSQEVKDPFFDRGGLSGSNAATSNAASAAVSKQGTSTDPNTLTSSSGKGTTSSTTPEPTAVEATKLRYEAWLTRTVTVGDGTLDPRVFAIEDLTPVGVVDGGNGQQAVMFFSQAAGKTVSFPVGTIFFDGWLTELRPEGVVFSSNDDRRIIRMRSWARSLSNLG